MKRTADCVKGTWKNMTGLKSELHALHVSTRQKLDDLERKYNTMYNNREPADVDDDDEHEHLDALLASTPARRDERMKTALAEAELQLEDEVRRHAIQCFFDNNFVYMGTSIVIDPRSGGAYTSVTRSELRDLINKFLANLQLQPLTKKCPLWNDWFLRVHLGMSDIDKRSTKPLIVRRLISRENMQRTLEKLLAAYKTEI